MTACALILDFGGPILVTPFEVLRRFERRRGLESGTFEWTGPFDPDRDPLWRRVVAAEIDQPAYWAARAADAAAMTNIGEGSGNSGIRGLMAELYPCTDIDSAIRPPVYETVRAARAAGLRTAVLTNDLASFYSDEWISRARVLEEFDVVIDGSIAGVFKPDPAAYRLTLEALEVTADQALFVDDHAPNVEGARAMGMRAMLFDVTRPAQSYREIGWSLGLDPRP
ncbi:HAD-IA family hydrolase [Nocardia africana]|uniref:Haloacetate dehalogenase H-2 n=1 Tax=Nocardia africana TaxID=134964 RepID=A0A378WX00_9NOCA|nr:HAD-IA family hydrolase [Nocardia africana]MCC3313775.1 HAD-IA family hydrolase [Nocardia africana]SUA44843.1 Haloacetate dehalogenase H-2 [Nocardia africana]